MAETTTRKTIREAAARHLGLLIEALVTSVSAEGNDRIVVDKLADITPDAERMRDSWVYHPNGTNETNWRRIQKYDYPNSREVLVSRDFNPVPTATDPIQIYMMLDPDEWNALINQALQRLYFVDRIAVPIIADEKEYALSAAGEIWLQSSGQIHSIKFRRTAEAGLETEQEVSAYSIQEDTNVLTIKLHSPPPSATQYQMIIVGRRNYAAISTDAATTTCPYPLLLRAVVVAAVHKIFEKYGANIKRLYGSTSIIEERELEKEKARWLPQLQSREYVQQEEWEGVEIDSVWRSPAW